MNTSQVKTSVDASVELISAGPRTPEELEQDACVLLDAIEAQVADIALGATVACNFEESIIDLLCTVEASSTAEVHRKLSTISEVIERAFAQDELRMSTAPSAAVCSGAKHGS
jgi:hypothetical protein